jgi:hypothetical protein
VAFPALSPSAAARGSRSVLPATVDAGPVRRAYPETFTHATAIGPIIELQLALSRLHHD